MKLKKALKIAVAMLLVVCMLLPVLASCKKKTPETPNNTPTPQPNPKPEENLTACQHAVTVLKNVRDTACDAEGYTGDKVCAACGTVVATGTAIPKSAHTYDAGQTTKNPTCMDTGVKTFTCTGCGTTKSESINKVPHSDVYHDALDGGHTHTCEHCTMNEYDEHTPTDNGTFFPASCLEAAYTLYTCADCGGIYKVYSQVEEDKAIGHSWGEWVIIDATCSATGSKTHFCKNGCGHSETIEIPVIPTAHSYTEQSRDHATCSAEGTIYYVCVYCDAPKTETIAKLPHVLGDAAPAGDGWTHQYCTNDCGYKVSTFDASTRDNATVNTDAITADSNFGVSMETATMEFPKELVSSMTETAGADVAINAGVVENKEELLNKVDEAQKARLENVDIYDFSVSVGGAPLNFDGNTVTVTIPYTLKAGEDPEGILIWFVDDDGSIQSYSAVYDAESETVTFEAEHFSYYAVAYEETQAMKCKRGVHLPEVKLVVEPSCTIYGHTIYECTFCHHIEISDIQDKLNHSYSDMIQPDVTCDEGGYITQICLNENCDHVAYHNYIRATGHTITEAATCTKGAVCSTCNKVAIPARGHDYTDWVIVVEPTDIKSGLRRRYCLRCGINEDVKLAATGNVTKLEFDSFEDVFDSLAKSVLGFENGTASWLFEEGTTKTKVDITLNKEAAGYVALIDVNDTWISDGENRYYKMQALYRNGLLFMVEESTNEPAKSIDIMGYINMPINESVKMMALAFEQINPIMEAYFEEIDTALKGLNDKMGAKLDEELAAAGAEFRMADVLDTMKSIKTLYAYIALKLGAATNIMMEDGVEVPTLDDLLTIADAFMTKTEANGRTDYTISTAPFIEALNTIVTWLEDKSEASIADLIWELYGADITAAYPNITDWSGIIAKLKATYTDQTKVSDLVDDLITALEKEDICTIDELYAAIDALALQAMGQVIDSAALVKEYADMTLGDMIAGMTDGEGTMETLFDGMDGMLSSMLFGSIELPQIGSIDNLAQMGRSLLDSYDPAFEFSFAIDAAGNLLDMNLSGATMTKLPADAPAGEEPQELVKISGSIKNDSTVKVQIPDKMKPVQDVKVEASFDAAGNLTVKLPAGFEPNFDIQGSIDVALKDYVMIDTELTNSLDYNVYRLPKELWSKTQHIGTYYLYNGKYYTAEDISFNGEQITSMAALCDIMADPTVLLPDADAEPYAYIEGTNGYEPIYRTYFGFVAMIDGEWCLLKDCYYDRFVHDAEDSFELYYYSQAVNYMAAMAGLEMAQWYSYDREFYYNNEFLPVYDTAFYLDVETWGSETIRAYVTLIDDKIYLCETSWVWNSHYVLCEEIANLPTHDDMETWGTDNDFYTADGTKITETVKQVSLYAYVPTYYMAVSADTYVAIDAYGFDAIATTGRDTVTLPDGNTLYVKETIPEYDEDGEYDSLTTGYVKLPSGQFIHTVAFYMQGEIVKVIYRQATSTNHAALSNMFDLEQYLTKVDATTYKFSAALFTDLKAKCTEEGDSYLLTVEGTMPVGNMTVDLGVMLTQYIVMPSSITALGAQYNKSFDWSDYFPSGSPSSNFFVAANEDGSITIQHRDGGTLTVNYNFNSYPFQFPADDYLAYDAEKSTETGLPIYSAIGGYSFVNGFVYQNGKYYDYRTYSQVKFETVSAPETVIRQYWRLGNLYSRYITDLDLSEEGEDLYPVYEGTVYFGRNYHSNYSLTMFFIVKDGKLMVLEGTQQMGESILKFEGYSPVSEYFDSITLTRGEAYTSEDIYVGGQKVTTYRMALSWSDKNANGETVRSYTTYVYYYDGSKYIVDYEYEDNYLEIGEEWTSDLPVHDKVETEQSIYANGTFTYQNFYRLTMRYYVKLADSYYDWSYNSESYSYRRISERSMLEALADKDIFYCLESYNGTVVYYNYYDPATQTFSGLIDVLPEYAATTRNWIDSGTFDNQWSTVYEVIGYVAESLVWEEQDDGTVFVHRLGDNDGYLMGQDGYYVSATKALAQDGSSYIMCTTIQKAYFSTDMLKHNGVFNDCVSLNADQTAVTVNVLFIDKIPEHLRDGFRIQINAWNGDSYSSTSYSFAQLAGLLGFEELGGGNQNSNGPSYEFSDREELEDVFFN